MNKSVSIITDFDGSKITHINDIIFKLSKRIDWNEVEKYLKEYIGEYLKKRSMNMARVVGIGKQSFEDIRQKKCFYVDKTNFIKEWWEAEDDVTLITRPRRFGKTLNMDMIKCFFSNEYKDRGDLFEGLDIWKEEKYREVQGKYPVIFLSFAKIKQNNYVDAVSEIKRVICDEVQKYIFLKDWDGLTAEEKNNLKNVTYGMDTVTAQEAINNLSNYLSRYYGKKPSFCLMNTTHRCRRHIQTDTGRNLSVLQEVFLIQHLKQIRILKER